jgi:hypothetical protein
MTSQRTLLTSWHRWGYRGVEGEEEGKENKMERSDEAAEMDNNQSSILLPERSTLPGSSHHTKDSPSAFTSPLVEEVWRVRRPWTQ